MNATLQDTRFIPKLTLLSSVIFLLALSVMLDGAPVPKDEEKEIARRHVELQGEWICCSMKSELPERRLPDETGNSYHLVFDDHHLSILIRDRDGKITGHECSDFELRKSNTRILLVRNRVSSHKGGIDRYSPTYFIDFNKPQITLSFFVQNDLRGTYADLTKNKPIDDYCPVHWTYNPVKKKR